MKYDVIVSQENQTSWNKSVSSGQHNVTFHDLRPYTLTIIDVTADMGNYRAYQNASSTSPEIGNDYWSTMHIFMKIENALFHYL